MIEAKINHRTSPRPVSRSIDMIYPCVTARLKERFGDLDQKVWEKLLGGNEDREIEKYDFAVVNYLFFNILQRERAFQSSHEPEGRMRTGGRRL